MDMHESWSWVPTEQGAQGAGTMGLLGPGHCTHQHVWEPGYGGPGREVGCQRESTTTCHATPWARLLHPQLCESLGSGRLRYVAWRDGTTGLPRPGWCPQLCVWVWRLRTGKARAWKANVPGLLGPCHSICWVPTNSLWWQKAAHIFIFCWHQTQQDVWHHGPELTGM